MSLALIEKIILKKFDDASWEYFQDKKIVSKKVLLNFKGDDEQYFECVKEICKKHYLRWSVEDRTIYIHATIPVEDLSLLGSKVGTLIALLCSESRRTFSLDEAGAHSELSLTFIRHLLNGCHHG